MDSRPFQTNPFQFFRSFEKRSFSPSVDEGM